MGFEHVPEPLRTQLLKSQDIRQVVVLGYWQQLLRTDPADLQAEIEVEMERITAPCLNVFGHTLSDRERTYLQDHVSTVFIEEWPDRGHHVHLAEADRFAVRLRSFIDQCRRDGGRPRRGRATAIHQRMEG